MGEQEGPDFVFLDDMGRPYRVRTWDDGRPWLFFWHPDKVWVSHRMLSVAEVGRFRSRALPTEQAALYQEADRG